MSADVSVRLAWPDDASRIAAVQRAHWARTYGAVVDPAELDALDTADEVELAVAFPDGRRTPLVDRALSVLRTLS